MQPKRLLILSLILNCFLLIGCYAVLIRPADQALTNKTHLLREKNKQFTLIKGQLKNNLTPINPAKTTPNSQYIHTMTEHIHQTGLQILRLNPTHPKKLEKTHILTINYVLSGNFTQYMRLLNVLNQQKFATYWQMMIIHSDKPSDLIIKAGQAIVF